ncbi:MAG TPA: amino acid permease, partial [Planctomycetaceae bacterium]|nr:amino acid permease [Planctomycetaceae bacterium]
MKFGTFGGVFTPCTLTILGVIMFLRFGQVVGQAGVLYAILIVVASKTITTLTTLSLSAIASNTRVKGGGAYYLISRSLGVEFGGA